MPTNAQSQSASAALGTLPGVTADVMASPTSSEVFGLVTVTIPANQTIPVAVPGDFFLVDSCTGMATVMAAPAAFLQIAPDQRPFIPIRALGQSVKLMNPFKGLQLANLTAAAIVVTLYVGFAETHYEDNPFTPRIVAPLSLGSGLLLHLVRPVNTTPYAQGQVVGGATTANNTLFLDPRTPGNSVNIRKVIIWKSSPTLLNASFRLWFFTGQIAPYADAAPFPLNPGNCSFCIGWVDIPSFIVEDATSSAAIALISDFNLVGATNIVNGSLYLVLTAEAAYVPIASEIFAIQICGEAW
jgi:hypothetical protein